MKTDLDQVRTLLAKQLIFGRPLFESNPQLDSPLSKADSPELKIRKTLWLGNKYRHLLELLRKVRDNQTRWLLLSRWLNQEKVCEPGDFLPQELKRLAKKLPHGLVGKGARHYSLVEIWLPYFNQLLQERDRLNARRVQRVKDELEKVGYKDEAIDAALSKRSPTEVVYSWLAARGLGSPETFRNEHSRTAKRLRGLTSEVRRAVFGRELKDLAAMGFPSQQRRKAQGRRHHRVV